jgi:hypothetical protein
MSDFRSLLQRAIEVWKEENIPIPPGVEPEVIAKFETRYGVKLPADLREFYLAVNGMGDDYDEKGFFRFWPIEQVTPIAEYAPEVVATHPESAEYFCFFDHSIDLFMYAIQLTFDSDTSCPIAMVYPQTPASGSSFLPRFESFFEMIRVYVASPDGLF